MQVLFRDHLDQHCDRTGITMPPLLRDYLVDLLDSRLRRVDLIPEPSFGERYMILCSQGRMGDLADYGDCCLFFTSLLPEYGRRRGLSMDYYATLGISSYHIVGDRLEDSRYTQLGDWFYTLQRILNSAIHPDVRVQLWGF